MKTLKTEEYSYFYKLLLLLLILVGTGLILSFSISYSYSIVQGRGININGESENIGIFNLFIKQLIATLVGLGGILYLLKTPSDFLRKASDWMAIIAGVAMIYTVFAAPEINGSKRWLVIGSVSLQTGDFARIALILYLSNIFAQYHKVLHSERNKDRRALFAQRLLIRFMIAVVVYLGALYLQRDYSSFLISAAVIMGIVLVSDIPIAWKITGIITAVALFILIIASDPNRMMRIANYLQPGKDPLGAEFQIKKSYEIIGNGGLLGSGVGSNMLDVLRLPYFNNDFVFSIIVGEYGLIGALGIIVLFWMLCFYTYRLGNKLYIVDRYYYFLLLAGVINLIVSVVAHIAVTIGIAPTAGLNLPFYSSGGSSMITSLLSYGLILRAALALDYYEKNIGEKNIGEKNMGEKNMREKNNTPKSNANITAPPVSHQVLHPVPHSVSPPAYGNTHSTERMKY